MLRYYKQLNEDGSLNTIGYTTGNISPDKQITKEEYDTLSEEIKTKTEAENKAIMDYAQKVKAGTITLEEVPEQYREQVSYIINPPTPQPSEDFQSGYDQALLDLAETGGLQ